MRVAVRVLDDAGRSTVRIVSRPEPPVTEGHVAVAVRAVAFDVLELDRRPPGPDDGPRSVGSVCSGHVVELGPGVEGLSLGQHVVGVVRRGACADRLVAPAAGVFPMDPALGHDQAVLIPFAGLTAAFALRSADAASEPERIVVVGASGAVGCFVAGLTRDRSATVVGVTSGADKLARIREVGFSAVVDSARPDAACRMSEALGGAAADLVIDVPSALTARHAALLVAPGGRLVRCNVRRRSFSPWTDTERAAFAASVIDFELIPTVARRHHELPCVVGEITQGLLSGRIDVPVTRFPLSEVAQAFALRARGADVVGAIVIEP